MLSTLDHQLLIWVNVHLHHPMLWEWTKWLTWFGDHRVVLSLAGLLTVLAWRSRRPLALGGFSGVFVTLVLTRLIKDLVARARPVEVLDGLHAIGGGLSHSFPSGHVAGFTALAVVAGFHWPRHRVLWWGLSVGMVWTRLYLGRHFPSDCVAGMFLGALVSFGVIWLFDQIGKRRSGAEPIST